MLKKIWHLAGHIKVSFVLLMLSALTLFIGSMYGNNHFTLIRALNRTRVQDWFMANIEAHADAIWWTPLLFIIMACLGVNIFICAVNRMVQILSQRRSSSKKRLFYLLTPTLIHYGFIVIILGHLLTFTGGRWETIPLETDMRIDVGPQKEPLTVVSMKDTFHAETSAMRHRVRQTRVRLKDNQNREFVLQYLKPVRIHGHFLFLDKAKQKKRTAPVKPKLDDASKETCNQAHLFHQKTPKPSGLRLLIVSDPGLGLIISGLTVIMLLMGWYFIFPVNGLQNSKPLR